MKFIDTLTKKIKDIDEDELISFRKKSADYIISIPHSGRLIPLKFKDRYRIDRSMLISDDLHTDKLYETNKGFEIVFKLSQSFINVSRFRVGSKDKSLPLHLQRDPLHGESLLGGPHLIKEYSQQEKEEILKFYDIYHDKLQEAINEMKKKNGFALIFDCHSMNSVALQNTPDEGKERTDFNVGTLDDTSASKKIISVFMKNFEKEAKDYTIRKNYPYKGGFITRRYADPKNNVHVIQIETKRSLFMHEGLNNEKDSFKVREKELREINKILSKIFEETSKRV